MSLDFQAGTSDVAKVADFQDPNSAQDFIGNLGIIQDDFEELAESADDAKETVRDVRDALGVFRSVQKKADKVEKLLDGLEKVASLATKVGAISKPAQALQKIFHQLGEVTGKVETTSGNIADKVDPFRENVLKPLETNLKKARDGFEDAAEGVGKVQTTATQISTALDAMKNSGLPDAATAASELEDCLDQLASPSNEAMFEIDLKYQQARAAVDPIKNLKDGIPELGDLGVIIQMENQLDGILDAIGFLEKPLDLLDAALSEVKWALDAAQSVYDNVVAPVVDPVIEATGITALLDDVSAELAKLLPDVDLLDGFADITDLIEAEISAPDVPLVDFGSAPDFSGASIDFSSFDAPLSGLAIPDVPNGMSVQNGTFNLPKADFDPGSVGRAGLPFNFDAPIFASLNLSVPDKQDIWNALSDNTGSATESGASPNSADHIRADSGELLIGGDGHDTLVYRAGSGAQEVLIGGGGNDNFFRSVTDANTDDFDILIGGGGDDFFNARAAVNVTFLSFISDYRFVADEVNTTLTVTHMNLTGGLDEGVDVIDYEAGGGAIMSFDGYAIDIETFVNGLQNATQSNPNLTGDRDRDADGNVLTGGAQNNATPTRDFLFGDDGTFSIANTLTGKELDDLLVGGGGADLLRAGKDDDYLDGGPGNDTLIGGEGLDVADFRSETRSVQLYLDETTGNAEANGLTITDVVSEVERINGSLQGDIIFGSQTAGNLILGDDGADFLRSIGAGPGGGLATGGSYLSGGDDQDTIILDTGGDIAEGGASRDIFYGVLGARPDSNGNLIIGGNGVSVGDEWDILTYGTGAISSGNEPGSGNLNQAYASSLDLLEDYKLSNLNAADYIEADVAQGLVTRRLTSDDSAQGVDKFREIEVLIGSDNADHFHVDGAYDENQDGSGQVINLQRVAGGDGNDVFTTGLIARATTDENGNVSYEDRAATADKPELYGNGGDDLFVLTDAYSVSGGNGTDTLDLSTNANLKWYVNAADADVGIQAYYADESLPEPNSDPSAPSADGVAAGLDKVEIILGGALGDVIIGDDDVTLVEGGGGADYLRTKGGTSQTTTQLRGQEGNDHLVGGRKRDLLFGGDGDDVLDLSLGNSTGAIEYATGGAGGDLFFVGDTTGDIRIFGGNRSGDIPTEDDSAESGAYLDTVSFTKGQIGLETTTQGIQIDLIDNSNTGAAAKIRVYDIERVIGTSFDDKIRGDSGANVLHGAGGDDKLFGRSGADILIGGRGADELYGGDGADIIFGAGNPTGETTILVNVGVAGGVIPVEQSTAHLNRDVVDGGDGQDTLTFSALAPKIDPSNNSTSAGLIGSVVVDLQDGASTFTGRATFTQDVLRLQNFAETDAVTRISNIENVVGTGKGDTIKGNGVANVLNGGEGSDDLHGRGGADVLIGGIGKDTSYGGGQDDVIVGGLGTDSHFGGDGTDTADYSGSVSTLFELDDFSGGILVGGSITASFETVNYAWQDGSTASKDADGFDVFASDAFRILNPEFARKGLHVDDGVVAAVEAGADSTYAVVASDVTATHTDSFEAIEHFIGGNGDDTFRASENYATFRFDGGEGLDLFEYTGDAALDVDLAAAGVNATAGASDPLALELINVEDVTGGANTDTLRGDQSDNHLNGRGGDDTFEGRGGDDRIDGGAGTDTAIFSGAFADYSVAKRGSGVVEVIDRRLGADNEGRDQLFNVESLQFSDQTVLTTDLQTVTPIGEWGEVNVSLDPTLAEDDQWLRVTLDGAYANPVIVATIMTTNEADIVTTRIRNVEGSNTSAGTAASFEIRLDETSNLDGFHASETIRFLAVESGRHALDDGTVIEAGTFVTDRVYQSTNQETPVPQISFSADITDARVFTSLNTEAGGDWAVSRVHDVDDTGFSAAMQEEEAKSNGHGNETIGWIAVGGSTAVTVQVDEVPVDLGSFGLAAIQTIAGADPVVVRGDAGNIYLQEDTSLNDEIGHGFETVALLDFNRDAGVLLRENSDPIDGFRAYETDALSAIGGQLPLINWDADFAVLADLKVVDVSSADALGAFRTSAEGVFVYDPGNAFSDLGAGESHLDAFTLTVEDGSGGQASVGIEVTVTGLDQILGTEQRDRLTGTAEDDILNGLGGRDIYYGSAGADRFVMGDGDKDRIVGLDATDRIDVSDWGVDGLDGLELLDSKGRIIIRDADRENVAVIHANDGITSADLSADSFVFALAEDQLLAGTDAKKNVLRGGDGDDVLQLTEGRAQVYGDAGADTFVFGASTDGRTIIKDFDQTEGDRIDVTAWGVDAFDELAVTQNHRFVFVQDLSDKSNTVRLDRADTELTASDISASDFVGFDDNPFLV